jgi:predicted secreted protein
MKTLIATALLATSLMAGVSAPALAGDSSSPSYQDQLTSLWIATGDATYARLAGLSEAQIAATKRPPAVFPLFNRN